MPHNYRRILEAALCTPWAIEPNRGAEVLAFLMSKADGRVFSQSEIEAAVDTRAQGEDRRQDVRSIAILPLKGIIAHRAEQVNNMSGNGGTSTELFEQRFDQAAGDPNVKAIVLDVRSPGGTIDGVTELTSKIFGARGTKPIIAVANAFAASAAYWIASAAEEIVVTPSGQVGSIGVWTAHEDISEEMAAKGRKTTLISAGEFKVENNMFGPLTEEGRQALQESVDFTMAAFVKDVARGRGVSVSDVRKDFGKGRMVKAKQAVESGMADRVDTLENVIAKLQRGPARKSNRAASARRRLALAG